MKSIYIHIFSLTLFLSSPNIFPQWSNNPNQNLQISNFGYFVSACEDGMGGAFVGWTTANNPAPTSWLQWVDKYGYVRWSQPLHITGNGVAQTQLKLIKSEPGKVILIFLDCIEVGWDSVYWGPILHTYLRANKIDTTGFLNWGEHGITITEDTAVTYAVYGVVEDEDYGIYLAWTNLYPPYYTGSEDSAVIRVQRISNTGDRLWGKTGKYISTWYGYNFPDPYISRRKPDGIFLRYYKQNVGNTLESINPDMSIRWSRVNYWYWDIIPDENGGGVWARTINNTGTIFHSIIANKIDDAGNLIWSDSGIVIDDNLDYLSGIVDYKILIDSSLVTLWQKKREDNQLVINTYLQILDKNGMPEFSDSNYSVKDTNYNVVGGKIIISDSTNFIIAWIEGISNESKYLAQKFNRDVEKLWNSNGLVYSLMTHDTRAIVSDGNNGFIDAFGKYYPAPIGVFSQQVSKNGILGEVITSIHDDEINNEFNFILNQNYPNPFNSETIINFELNQSEDIELNIYNCLGENVRNLFVGAKEKGHHSMKWDGKDKNNFNLSSGIYFIELKTNFGNRQIVKTVLLK